MGLCVRNKVQLAVFLLLTLLVLSFIFSNSLQTAEVSAARSGRLAGLLKAFFDPNNRLTDGQFDHYVRKAAHFCEFGALGFCLMGLFDSFAAKRKGRQRFAAFALAAVFAAADESLQFFSDGRAPRIGDVFIDSAGSLCGVCFLLLILWLIQKRSSMQSR